MDFKPTAALASCFVLLAACDGAQSSRDAGVTPSFEGYAAQDLLFGANDNPEAVALVPGTDDVLVVSSKSRKLTRIRVTSDSLTEVRSQALFSADTSESELTSIAVEPGGQWAVLTRTLIDKDSGDEVTGCRGQVVFVNIADDTEFATVIASVDVGPMPDSVDISPDGRHVVVANERDVVWGKCEGVSTLPPPSLSLLELSDGPLSAVEVARINMSTNEEREPEQVRFFPDGSALAVTLQDSHEIAIINLQDALLNTSWVDADLQIVGLPKNLVGQDAWPDGVTVFEDGDGAAHIAVAGEANDTLVILDATGAMVALIEISASDLPVDWPRDGTWGPLFQPDSLASFTWAGRKYLAATLKSSGAVGFWDVTNVDEITVVSMVKVGINETAGADTVSTVSTEGIAASNSGFIVVANEGDGSVTLIRPL